MQKPIKVKRLLAWIRPIVGLFIFVFLWTVFSSSNSLLLPPLEQVAITLINEVVDGRLVKDTIYSTARVLIGVGIATLISMILGLISGFWRNLPAFLKGVVEILRPIPPIAWTPVAIIAFGIGNKPAVAIVALGAFFPIWFGVLQGISEVKAPHLRAARSLGSGRWLLLTDILIPSIFPYFIHGLKLGVGIGWFCVVAAEMIGASNGLGYGVQIFSLNLEIEKLYAYLLTIGVIGYLSQSLFSAVKPQLQIINHD